MAGSRLQGFLVTRYTEMGYRSLRHHIQKSKPSPENRHMDNRALNFRSLSHFQWCRALYCLPCRSAGTISDAMRLTRWRNS